MRLEMSKDGLLTLRNGCRLSVATGAWLSAQSMLEGERREAEGTW